MENSERLSHSIGNEDAVSIQVDDSSCSLVASIRKMIQDLSPVSTNCSIYRVPKTLREMNEKACVPQLVSIGPYHRGRPELQTMEKHKVQFLNAFLNRTKMELEKCVEVMKEWEERTRDSYAETVDLSSDEFVKMMLLDSCVVIEVIWRYNYADLKKETDYLSRLKMIFDLRRDMILLENQLPFFVLEGLYNQAFPSDQDDWRTFVDLCIDSFLDFMLIRNYNQIIGHITGVEPPPGGVKHFVDLLRICHSPTFPRLPPGDPDDTVQAMRKATELEEAGLVIRPGSGADPSTNIRYSKGILEIPTLTMDEDVEYLLRNLVAFEMCHYQYESYILDYIHFMDDLIDSSADVDLLMRNGIVNNFFSNSQAVADFFNSITNGSLMVNPNYYYHGVRENVNAYCQVPLHRWRGTLRRDYCSSPWIIASTVAAVVLLTLTFIQTICAIIGL